MAEAIRADDLRYILGLKLKSLRKARRLSLTELSERSGLSVSYLSQIEHGRKYPTHRKLTELARVLGVPFDELVSMQVSEELDALKSAFSSDLLREFPFSLFGVEPQALFGLVNDDPEKAGALLRALLEVGRTYDVQVEHFLFAALRSYQQMHRNYFEDLENAAAEFRAGHGWSLGEPVAEEELKRILEDDYGYHVDYTALAEHPILRDLTSAYLDRHPPRLLVHGDLPTPRRTFILAREIGYRHLDLMKDRNKTACWLRVKSFDQLLNNFRASYFAGAVLVDQQGLHKRMTEILATPRWDGDAFLQIMKDYRVSPETYFHRLSELMPKLFGLEELYFTRFQSPAGRNVFKLDTVFNMSRVPVPYGVGLNEEYCRRWRTVRLLQELDRAKGSDLLIGVQRSRFIDQDAEFFVISIAHRRVLSTAVNAAASLGFLVDDRFKRRVRFWNDPAVTRVDVNLTCERCSLGPDDCQDRTAPPRVWLENYRYEDREKALAEMPDALVT